MNQWRTQFEEHPLHAQLSEVVEIIRIISLKTDDENILSQFHRASVVIEVFRGFVKALNPECTTPEYLNKLNAPLKQIKPHLATFAANEDAGQISAANTYVDALTQVMPPFALPETAAEYAGTVSSLTASVDGLISVLSAKSKETETSLQTLKTELTALSKNADQTTKVVDTQKGRLDLAISDFQNQFSAAQDARRKEIQATEKGFTDQFDQFREKISGQITDHVTAQQNKLDDASSKFQEEAKQILREMEEKKDLAAKVLNVSTNVAVSGSYGKYAFHEKIAAEVFRGVSIIFMLALIIGAYKTVSILAGNASGGVVDWKLFSARSIITFTFSLPAFYAMRESSRHRAAEHRFRKMQLELAAIDPYLERLDKAERDKIKSTLSERFFAQPEVLDKGESVDATSLFGLLEKVMAALVKK